MLYANPALLNAETDHQLSFGHISYLGDIKQNSLTYSFPNKKGNHWAAGLQYINYGDFTQRDATGQEMGTFSVTDYYINLTHARTIDHITLGATAKLAVSRIAEFKSSAALVDLGGVFKHPEQDFTVALALKNIGYQLSTYNGEREPDAIRCAARHELQTGAHAAEILFNGAPPAAIRYCLPRYHGYRQAGWEQPGNKAEKNLRR